MKNTLAAILYAFGAMGMSEQEPYEPFQPSANPNPAAIRKARKERARELSLLRQAEIRQGIGKPPKHKRGKRRK